MGEKRTEDRGQRTEDRGQRAGSALLIKAHVNEVGKAGSMADGPVFLSISFSAAFARRTDSAAPWGEKAVHGQLICGRFGRERVTVSWISPLEDCVSLLVKWISPLEDCVSPLVKWISLMEDCVSPLVKWISLLEDRVSLLVKSISPLEDRVSPLVKSISPLEESEYPVEKHDFGLEYPLFRAGLKKISDKIWRTGILTG